LTFWLQTIRKTVANLEKSKQKIPEDSLKFMHEKLWNSHSDSKNLTNILQLPIFVIANKYDLFIKEDPYFSLFHR